MKKVSIGLWLVALALTTGMGCGQRPNECHRDAAGNADCPTRQYNPPDGDAAIW